MVLGTKKKVAKRVAVFGALGTVTCLLSLNTVIIVLFNLVQDPFTALVLGVVPLSLVWILIAQEIVAVLSCVGINLAYWKVKFGRFISCPKRILYAEWAYIGVLLPIYPPMIKYLGASPEIVLVFSGLFHHWIFGPLLVVLLAIGIQSFFKLNRVLERFMEKIEVLPEIDDWWVLIPSVLLGVFIHLIMDNIFLL